MANFIKNVISDVLKKHPDISKLTFILPSKRAGTFLKNYLAEIIDQTIFAPTVLSIEDFMESLSGLRKISQIELIFEFYNVYLAVTPKSQQDSFDVFSNWASVLLEDLNDIDQYLVEPSSIFQYLAAIQDIKHWSLNPSKTTLVDNYLKFWKTLPKYYNAYTDKLLQKNIGYQGLIYRNVVKKIPEYLSNNPNKHFVLIGFNALNKAEKEIIKTLLKSGSASIYFDIDTAFLNNVKNDAGFFMRQHKTAWSNFKSQFYLYESANYNTAKNISVYATPKNIGQAKIIGGIIKNLQQDNNDLNKTAIILANKALLSPILYALPNTVKALNITMGLPLKLAPIANLFKKLFEIHKKLSPKLYYKDVISVLSHQSVQPLFIADNINYAQNIIETLHKNNITWLSLEQLKTIETLSTNLIELFFGSWNNNPNVAIKNCIDITLKVRTFLNQQETTQPLGLEQTYGFFKLFNHLKNLNEAYQHILNIETLYNIYKELLQHETLDFEGEPLQGLQIMGLLESRVLDFDTVIISSVNEGLLPPGKSTPSLIPFDVKLEYNLPTYKEKDADYTYHFYRLLQRAKNIHLLYNTEVDTLKGGEKSRFITQLEIENSHQIKHYTITSQTAVDKPVLKTVAKTAAVMELIKTRAKKGFSPSSLANYIRNPIDFYHQTLLNINVFDMVEETVAANTLGTIIHNSLEYFYKPLESQFLTELHITNMILEIDNVVRQQFQEVYKKGVINSGKNLIVFEIAKRYVLNILKQEQTEIRAGNTIQIIAIEKALSTTINFPEIAFPVTLNGKIDRIDQYNGITRIIDYKTGKTQQNNLNLTNWQSLATDYNTYSKSFQILTYAYMLNALSPFKSPVEGGIISFKNLNSGFLKFTDKTKDVADNDNITPATLKDFFEVLKSIILEICNPEIAFQEKQNV